MQCPNCFQMVDGYKQYLTFVFAGTMRIKALDGIELSCGCEWLDVYFRSFEVDDRDDLTDVIILDSQKNEIIRFTDQMTCDQDIDED